ncbi:MAG: protein-L-isoaspartate(D-aspartate) O-methyltransferase [Thermoguttaceae bacterium]
MQIRSIFGCFLFFVSLFWSASFGVRHVLSETNGVFQADAEKRRIERLDRFPIVPDAERMVEKELVPQGDLNSDHVLDAVKRIPRHRFLPSSLRQIAYRDQAIAIGDAQTISPPYIVTFMTEKLAPKSTDKVLEIGTGSGYQAAVLSLLVDEVYTIEIVEPLGKKAESLLKTLKMDNVHVRVGDGYLGWPEAAPFDGIIVTCSPESVPQPLIDQLKEGGRMIIPVGERYQQTFYLCKKENGELVKEKLPQTLFVPMTGFAEEQRQILPNPENPVIRGGDFAATNDDGSPVGWHYSRQVTIIKDVEPPAPNFPKNVARFQSASEPKIPQLQSPRFARKSAQILQGFAIDGRVVKKVTLEYSIRGNLVASQINMQQTPTAILQLFDAKRNQIMEKRVGLVRGTFDWKRVQQEIDIPSGAREAVLLIGLPSATGELDVNNVVLKVIE